MKRKLKKFIYSPLVVIGIIAMVGIIVLNQPKIGKNPSGELLECIKKSSNYRDGYSQNLSETFQITSDKSFFATLYSFLFGKTKDLCLSQPIPIVDTNLKDFVSDQDVLVWLGHSAYFMQLDGKAFLIDPILSTASPFSFYNKPFESSDTYQLEDISSTDYLIITHNHYEPLDKVYENTQKEKFSLLTPKIGEVVYLNDQTQTFEK